jgi:LPXTG-motif cell wall-anchored protein
MRKLFLLLSLSLVVSLAFAPTAGAQTFAATPSDGSGDTMADGCPAGEFAAIPPNTLGEGGFACFETAEEAEYYAETGQLLQADDDMAGGAVADDGVANDQYADDEVTQLPDTGGPALLLPIAGFAMVILGGWFLNRRLN